MISNLGPRSHLEALLSTLGSLEGKKIVDIGCGLGELPRKLAENGAHVIGIDPLIDSTSEASSGRGRFRLLRAFAEEVPLADKSADSVLFIFSLHHVPVPNMRSALSEARRLLRDGGQLYVAEPIAEGPNFEVTAEFHDETAVRQAAAHALKLYAAPAFASIREFGYIDRRYFQSFEMFAERMIANKRFNDYKIEDVMKVQVRERFKALASEHGGNFDQPVRALLYNNPRRH